MMSHYARQIDVIASVPYTEKCYSIPMLQNFVPFSCAISSMGHIFHLPMNISSLPTIKQHHQTGWNADGQVERIYLSDNLLLLAEQALDFQ